MDLGIFAKTFPRPTLEETLNAVVAHGLKHVQFNLSCVGLPTLPTELGDSDRAPIARAFRDRGLTMSAISGTFNLIEEDEGHRAFVAQTPGAKQLFSGHNPNFEALELLASAARDLGTRIVTLSTGTREPAYMWRWHPKNVTRQSWDKVVGATRKVAEIASRHQVFMAFEPEISNVVDSICKARRLLDQVSSPWLKVVLDPANLIRPGDIPRMKEMIEEAFDWLGDDIALMHVKELGKNGQPGDLAPGQGILDYGFILNELERIGYNGTLIMHGLSEDQVEPGVKFMRKMMGFSKGTS